MLKAFEAEPDVVVFGRSNVIDEMSDGVGILMRVYGSVCNGLC